MILNYWEFWIIGVWIIEILLYKQFVTDSIQWQKLQFVPSVFKMVLSYYQFHIYLKYWYRQAWTNSVERLKAASDQGLHGLPFIQTFVDTPTLCKTDW